MLFPNFLNQEDYAGLSSTAQTHLRSTLVSPLLKTQKHDSYLKKGKFHMKQKL